MNNPRFSVGDSVMIRCKTVPELNSDFSIILEVEWQEFGVCSATERTLPPHWGYVTDCIKFSPRYGFFQESELRPIPPKNKKVICAIEYIKSLKGAEVI